MRRLFRARRPRVWQKKTVNYASPHPPKVVFRSTPHSGTQLPFHFGMYCGVSRRIVQHVKILEAGEALWSLEIRQFRMETERLAARHLKLRKRRKGIS